MKKETIIQTLKENYNRDLRKQVVKTIIANEKKSEIPDYKIINQIFSYVLSQLEWNMHSNSSQWDSLPLDIMYETFPNLDKTKWYKEQILTTKKKINLTVKED